MASPNGGIVGVDNEPESGTQDAVITTFNSSGTLTTAPRSTAVQYVIVAGGGGGDAAAARGADARDEGEVLASVIYRN